MASYDANLYACFIGIENSMFLHNGSCVEIRELLTKKIDYEKGLFINVSIVVYWTTDILFEQ
jgi:hypothetical protein